MPLSAEQQALFDHARRALPRWLTRGKTAALEWLHAYTQMMDSVRAQGQDWVDITYIDNATGSELDQHALDRGTIRRENESDTTLRERLRNITDVVTEPALKANVNALLAASGLGTSAWVELRRDRAHFQLPLGNYPTSVSQLAAAVGYGSWTGANAWKMNELSGTLNAVFGSNNWTVGFGSPLYGFDGPFGEFDKTERDFAVSHTDNAAAYWATGDNFDVTGTSDLGIVIVGQFSSLPGALRSVINKISGGLGWYMACDPSLGFRIVTSTVNGSYTNAAPPTNEWCILIATIDRSTGKIRTGLKSIFDNDSWVSTEVSLTAVDESNAIQIQLGSGAGLGACPLRIAWMALVTGTSVCTGLSANMSAALTNVRNYIFPRKTTGWCSRGYRMTNPQRPMGYLVILPFGTTAAMAEAVEEYLRQYGPAGYYFIVERRIGAP